MTTDNLNVISLQVEFCSFTFGKELPALKGTKLEIQHGESARTDYMERCDKFLSSTVATMERAIKDGKATEAQAVALLKKSLALNEKMLAETSAAWWAGMAADFLGHAQDDDKKFIYVLKSYSL